jgi:hypothetical protein
LVIFNFERHAFVLAAHACWSGRAELPPNSYLARLGLSYRFFGQRYNRLL